MSISSEDSPSPYSLATPIALDPHQATRRTCARTAVPAVVSLGIFGAVLLSGTMSAAQERDTSQVNGFYGAYQTAIPIEVPKFFGIAPSLQLAYSSSHRNGFVGIGWSLSGFPSIERMSAGRGAPNFDDSDIFVLDGQELVESTELGGTHATKIQTYVRIKHNESTDEWIVTSKDGTKSVYGPIYPVTHGVFVTTPTPNGSRTTLVETQYTFRWGLTRVEDTSGNRVDYAWWCDESAQDDVLDCYPSEVTYGDAKVTLTRESRPDKLRHANGTSVGATYRRLQSIQVSVGGKQARSYNLSYEPNEATNASVLSSIQQTGKNDTATLPPVQMQSDLGNAIGGVPQTWASYESVYSYEGRAYIYPGDYNGDGVQDLLYLHKNYTSQGWRFMAGGNNGFAAPVKWAAYDAWHYSDSNGPWIYPGDYNGDGKQDLLYLSKNYTRDGWKLLAGDTSGFAPPVKWAAYEPVSSGEESGAWVFPGDYTGDGKHDLLYLHSDHAVNGWRLLASKGTSAKVASTWVAYEAVNYGGGPWVFPGDYNGDGKQDLLYRTTTSYGNPFRLVASEGESGRDPVNWASGTNVHSRNWIFPGDYNGDGKQDLVYLHSNYSQQGWRLMESYGMGANDWFKWASYESVHSTDGGPWVFPADYDGDGKTDLLYLPTSYASLGYRLLRQGDSPETWRAYESKHAGRTWIRPGDYNGDGKPDLLYLANQYSTKGWRLMLNQAGSNLLVHTDNGMGGTTDIEYLPSSRWSNTNNPPVVATVHKVTQSDGRDHSSTTTYSYEGGLMDRVERQFLGFHKATETMPCLKYETQCPYEVTEFEQDYGSLSKPSRVDLYNGAGALQSSSISEYATNGSAIPYTSHQTAAWTYAYDGSDSVRSAVTRSFDKYGNITLETTWGDYDASGDEKTIRYQYFPNLTSYVVGKPAATDTFNGSSTSGTLLAQVLTYYDGQASWRVPPTKGRPTQSASWLNTSNSYATTKASYDAWGNVVSETDALGKTTKYTMDSSKQYIVKTVNPLGQSHSATWDPLCGVRTQVTDVNGGVSPRTYDALCRLTRIDYPGGDWVERMYSNYVDRLHTASVEVRTPSADGTTYQWTKTSTDGLGRTWRVTSKGPSRSNQHIYQDTGYNARGAVAWTTPPSYSGHSWKVYAIYDQQDRLIEVINEDETKTITEHRLLETTHTDENGHTRVEKRNLAGHVVEVQERLGNKNLVSSFAYDAVGNLTTAVDPAGNVSKFTYDSLRNKLTSSEPNIGKWSYEYDAAGRLVEQTDAKGQVTTYHYDAIGRRIKQTALAGTPEATSVTWKYDEARSGYKNASRRTSMTDAAGTVSYNYDAAGRLMNSTRVTKDGATYTFSKGYDVGGRLLWTKYPDGDSIGSAANPMRYDSAGRLTTIPGIVDRVEYRATGELATQHNANGTVITRKYTKHRGWLKSIDTMLGNSSLLHRLTYTYDDVGQIRSITNSKTDLSWTYEYDSIRRLTKAAHSGINADIGYAADTIGYTDDGNIKTRTNGPLSSYTYGPAGGKQPHAVTTTQGSGGTLSYEYDANGNMTSGAGRTLTWDGNNRLAAVNDSTFVYNGDGTRFSKTEGGIQTVYLGDYEHTGDVVTKYITLAGTLVAKRINDETQWLHTNHLGSTEAITDASGSIIHTKVHGVFGNVLVETGTTEHRGYTGQPADATGLIYLNARYYDPTLGRFISPDPVVPAATSIGLNRYAYAGNNPVNFTDTDGLSWFSKLRRKVRRAIKRFFKSAARKISRLSGKIAAKLSSIPIIGGSLAMPFQFHSAVFAGDVQQAARVAGTAVVMAAAAVLTVMTGGISSPLLYVAANAAIGFASGFATATINGASSRVALQAGAIGAAISAGTAALGKMNEAMRNSEIAQQQGGSPRNLTGQSRGFSLDGRGDGIKLGGGRFRWNYTRGGRSPLGGHQNGVGQIKLGPLGSDYKPGGIFDTLVEGYAGPHDWLNNAWGAYGSTGNLSSAYGLTQQLGNIVNVPVATPFAVAGLAQSAGATALVVGDVARIQAASSAAQRRSTSTFISATGM